MAEDLGAIRCALYVTRKKRYCKMVPNPGEIYCAQHLPVNVQLPSGKKRIPCPLDNKHSCYEDDLQNHIARCNARAKPKPIFYEENINSGVLAPTEAVKTHIKDVPTERLIEVLKKLDNVYNETFEPVSELSSFTSASFSEIPETMNFKHTRQVASLFALLEHHKLIKDGTAMVELGAGRVKCKFTMADSVLNKFDNKDKSMDEVRSQRIKIDIEHLDLKNLSSIHTCEEMVVTSKHLCGVATDFALRCIINYHLAQQKSPQQMCRFKGALIALCCHHRCEWKHYVGREFFYQNGFDEEEFNILLSVSSWATCGSRNHKHSTGTSQDNLCDNLKLNFSKDEQTKYGIKSKRLLDQARIDYINKNSLSGVLVYYTDEATSLENVALML